MTILIHNRQSTKVFKETKKNRCFLSMVINLFDLIAANSLKLKFRIAHYNFFLPFRFMRGNL
jgi:hypothetical protein